jgi:two-component system CheB/CheR fusion protein
MIASPCYYIYRHNCFKKKQKKLLKENRYRRLFESAKDGILILNAETGNIIDVNPFLIEMLGYSYEQFVEKQFGK